MSKNFLIYSTEQIATVSYYSRAEQDEKVYFDTRQEKNFWWAYPVQDYLELIAGDKRARKSLNN